MKHRIFSPIIFVGMILAMSGFLYPLKTRFDMTNHDRIKVVDVSFTAASVETLWVGFPAEIMSAQSATASVLVRPLGDPNCTIQDSKPTSSNSPRTIANPAAGTPCVNVPLTEVNATDKPAQDFGYGGIMMAIVQGNGFTGSVRLIFTSRGPK